MIAMPVIIRNIMAVVAGILAGSLINSGILTVGAYIIPYPEGVDTSTPEGLAAGIAQFRLVDFITPFLAHAVGTFAGASVAVLIASTNKLHLSLVVGVFFFLGGAYMVHLLPAPLWFEVLDLALAYLPPTYLANRLFSGRQ
jgi:hypothetical protein